MKLVTSLHRGSCLEAKHGFRIAHAASALATIVLAFTACSKNSPGEPPSDPRELAQVALARYAEGRATERELARALATARESPDARLAPALLAAFARVRLSDAEPTLPGLFRDALAPLPASAEPALIAELETPLPDLASGAALEERRAAVYRKAIVIAWLGAHPSERGARALFELLADADRAELALAALTGLIQSGPLALSRALSVLEDRDPSFAAYAARHAPPAVSGLEGQAHLLVAATVLGALRVPAGRTPLLTAIDRARTPALKAALALELTRFAFDAASLAAYRRVADATPESARVSTGISARQALVEGAERTFAPELVPWLLTKLAWFDEPSAPPELAVNGALLAAVRLMTAEQAPPVRALVTRRKRERERSEFARHEALLERCGALLSCYVVALSDESADESVAVKAAITLGASGSERARDAILLRYPRIRSEAARYWALQAALRLSPSPAPALVAKLRAELEQRRDPRLPGSRDPAFEQLVWQLALRASP